MEERDALNRGALDTSQSRIQQLKLVFFLHLQIIFYIQFYLHQGHDAYCCTQGICARLSGMKMSL